MQNNQNKFQKVKSIIESCETYAQVQCCLSFVKDDAFFDDILQKYQIFGIIQEKTYQIRNADLKHHNEELRKITANAR